MAAEAVKAKKDEKPDIETALVTAYLGRHADGEFYDYMIYPTLKDVTQRSAIPQRNEWMVDSADVVVAYVTHEWGGAARRSNMRGNAASALCSTRSLRSAW